MRKMAGFLILSLLILLPFMEILFCPAMAQPSLPVHNVDTDLYYATIQEAISADETKENHTIFVGAGTYYENVVINKSVSLVGEGKNVATVDGKGIESVISVEATNVTVKGFTVQNSGTESLDSGIRITFAWHAIIEENLVRNCHEGISAYLLGGNHLIKNNRIVECSRYAIFLQTCFDNTVEGNTLTQNNFTITMQVSSRNIIKGNNISQNSKGIYLYTSMDNVIVKNDIIDNTEWGILLREFSENNTIVDNTIERNDYGIHCVDSGQNIVKHNRFIENRRQAYEEGYWQEPNTWHDPQAGEGNYWSDYDGIDENGNGIGESPYRISVSFFSSHDGNWDNYPLVLILIDQVHVSHKECNVGSPATISFHAGLHPQNRTNTPSAWLIDDSSIIGGTFYVNETLYTTNETGWISFHATSEAAAQHIWIPSNCYQMVENPSIEWVTPWVSHVWSFVTQYWYWIALAVGLIIVAIIKIRPKPLETQLEPDEVVIKQFSGQRGLTEWLARKGGLSLGRWYVTNRRLIYEGQIQYQDMKRSIVFPGWARKEPDVFSYPLDNLEDIEIIEKGKLRGKYIQAVFKKNGEKEQVQIYTRKIEDLMRTIMHTKESEKT